MTKRFKPTRKLEAFTCVPRAGHDSYRDEPSLLNLPINLIIISGYFIKF